MAAITTADQAGLPFTASLKYLRRDPKYEREKPFSCLIDLANVPGAEQTNIVSDVFENIVIKDGRKHSHEFGIDKTGFELVDLGDHHPASSFENTEWLKRVYYPFVEEMVLRKLGAKEVRVFEHQVCPLPPYGLRPLSGRRDTDSSSFDIDTQGSAGPTHGALSITIHPLTKSMLVSTCASSVTKHKREH